MNDLRILSHGKLSSLSSGFSLGGSTFSILVIPKNTTVDLGTTVLCKCVCDTEASALPANAINLSNYDVYWGAGETIKNQ